MIYEVFKAANGYIVRPMRPDKYEYHDPAQCYVFNDYSKLADKLHELLDDPRSSEPRK